MKLSYWVAVCLTDSRGYSIRARTRREVVEVLKSDRIDEEDYDPPCKVTVEYRDAFDLLRQCMGEGSIYEGDG